jgi:phage shock protein C
MSGRMYRSERDRMIAGVCGGLADHLDIDPTLVRIAFVALAFIHGIGIIAYLVMAVIVPREGAAHLPPREAVQANAREYGEQARQAVAQVRGTDSAGGSENTGAEGGAEADEAPAAPESGGEHAPPPPPAAASRSGARAGGILGAVLVVLGLLLLAHNLGFFWWIEWGVWWPVILVGLGLLLAIRSLRR